MGTASLAHQAARRKKRIAGLVGATLAATALTVALAYWWNTARQEKPFPAPKVLPTNVHQQLSGYSFTRSIEGRQIFTVHADRTVAFRQGGATVLEGVYVEVFGREGNRHDVLRTDRCEYDPKTGDLFSSGRVEIELNGREAGLGPKQAARERRVPILLETSRLSFNQQGSRVVTDQSVRFTAGPTSGSARGLVYATDAGWLELKRDVKMELPLRGPTSASTGQAPIRLAAAHLRYDSSRGGNGAINLDGPLEIFQGTRRVLADHGLIALDERGRVQRASLEGNVRATESSVLRKINAKADRVEGEFDPRNVQLRTVSAEGNVLVETLHGEATTSRLAAQAVRVNFLGVHPQPQSGGASGSVVVELNTSGGKSSSSLGRTVNVGFPVEKKLLIADQVLFTFHPGSTSLSDLQTIGAGKLELLPADAGLGKREINAGQLLMAFDPKGRLETLRGKPPTRIVFSPPTSAPPGTPSKESSAERLEGTFDAETQTLRQMAQGGDYHFQEGDRQASADRADYSAVNQTLILTGHPELWDSSARISADRIGFDLRTNAAEGLGKVKSTHFQGNAPGDSASRGRAPSASGDPTHVLADRVIADQRSQLVRYEGHVRAWRGSDVVESASLDVYRAQRRMSSGAKVLTSHFQTGNLVPSPAAAPASQRKTRPVTIRADRLDYFDAGRKASYRGNVQLRTENTILQAERMDVYFSDSPSGEASQIERAVSDGKVLVVQPGRRATGEHAQYAADAGTITLTGGPPSLYDEEEGFTTGQRLTFYVRDDRLLVDGGDNSPTLSKHRVAQ